MDRNETIYSSSYMIGVEEIRTPKTGLKFGNSLRNITLLAVMDECGVFSEWMKAHIVSGITDLAIVWYYDGDDVEIDCIYDHSSGEVYWENKIKDEDYKWTDSDEKLLCSILMWADVESTIA